MYLEGFEIELLDTYDPSLKRITGHRFLVDGVLYVRPRNVLMRGVGRVRSFFTLLQDDAAGFLGYREDEDGYIEVWRRPPGSMEWIAGKDIIPEV